MDTGFSIATDPLLPWLVISLLAGVGLAILALGWVRRARGVWWRAGLLAALLLALINPSLMSERRAMKKDIAVILVDESPSQSIGDRRAQTQAALDRVLNAVKDDPALETRVARFGGEASAALGDEGTRAFAALDRAMADIPRKRFAGAILITDGQIHDAPALAKGAPTATLPGPIHALLTGHRGELDRRLVVVRAPAFGLVDKPVTVTVRIDDTDPAAPAVAPLRVRRDGGEEEALAVPINQPFDFSVTLKHGGQTILELSTDRGPHDLTDVAKRAVVAINGVRDRLRVLLISGEPHPGERTWRNLLKADPSVDLVHFTILRPPEKQDGTPISELSLIAFPIRELFEVKLTEFDLIIFDRYRRRNIIPRNYLQAVAQYVQNGGAVLEAAGPSYATNNSLFYSPLGEVLPGEPSGRVFEQGFRPEVTELGRRHPVTADLEGGGIDGGQPIWGRWFRQVEITARHGQTIMVGIDGRPLLVLDRVGKGRIAQIASDQIWLWARGFEGGGPQGELLRRLAHWLMKEPALEEEDLQAVVANGGLAITRRSLTAGDATITVTDPLGATSSVTLTDHPDGKASGRLAVTVPGLYRIDDGARTTLAAVGAVNPREFADVRATDAILKPIADATGGGVFWLGDGTAPDVRRVAAEGATAGRDWLGLVSRRDYEVTGVERTPIAPAGVVLILALLAAGLAWYRESR